MTNPTRGAEQVARRIEAECYKSEIEDSINSSDSSFDAKRCAKLVAAAIDEAVGEIQLEFNKLLTQNSYLLEKVKKIEKRRNQLKSASASFREKNLTKVREYNKKWMRKKRLNPEKEEKSL